MNKKALFIPLIIIGSLVAGSVLGKKYWTKTNISDESTNVPISDKNYLSSKYKNEITKQFPLIFASETEIKNWETYKNQKFGYSIKFPPTFEVVRGGFVDGVAIRSKEVIFYGIDIFPSTAKFDNLDAFYKWGENEYKPGWQMGILPFYSLEKILVNDIRGAVATYKNDDEDIYYRVLLYKDSEIFIIEFNSRLSDYNILEKIVSTLKFDS